MSTHCAKLLVLSLLFLSAWLPGALLAAPEGGCVVSTSIVDGRKFKADICLPNPGGGADYEMDFELEFDPVDLQNLSVACIGFSVEVLNAAAIANVDARLPDPANQAIDPALPLRVTIEPPVGCGLAFSDDYDAEIDATNLTWVPGSPYRLMKAPIGGAYRDVTGEVLAGSVRARGCGGTFSEFVLVTDSLQDYASETSAAYADLGNLLNDPAIAPTAATTLGSDRNGSQAAYQSGVYVAAIERLDDILAHCDTLGGAALPNRWRSARDLDNLEGEIVGRTSHLRFLLGRLNGDP